MGKRGGGNSAAARVKRRAATFPKLVCPDCGYSYTPDFRGWAFKTNNETKCAGFPKTPRKMETYLHPFVQEEKK